MFVAMLMSVHLANLQLIKGQNEKNPTRQSLDETNNIKGTFTDQTAKIITVASSVPRLLNNRRSSGVNRHNWSVED